MKEFLLLVNMLTMVRNSLGIRLFRTVEIDVDSVRKDVAENRDATNIVLLDLFFGMTSLVF